MIPKKIHYCWIGNEQPPLIKNCIQSWKNILPDFELICWDTSNFEVDKHAWVKEAIKNKKYAFASDYIRFYALYNQGGIYLDTDVQVVKNFSPLLHHSSFMGYDAIGGLESAILGAEPQQEWVKHLLQYYANKHFQKSDGTLNMLPLPYIIKQVFEDKYNDVPQASNNITCIEEASLTMYPNEYFSPKNIHLKKIKTTPQTYTIHHYDGSWVNKNTGYFFKKLIHRAIIFFAGEQFHKKISLNFRKKS